MDVRAWLSSSLVPFEIVASSLTGGGSDRDSVDVDVDVDDYDVSDAGPSPDNGATREQRRRSRKSASQYSWMRTVHGRNYRVHNLDTTDQAAYRKATRVARGVFDPGAK